jgi:hypothetical protein
MLSGQKTRNLYIQIFSEGKKIFKKVSLLSINAEKKQLRKQLLLISPTLALVCANLVLALREIFKVR